MLHMQEDESILQRGMDDNHFVQTIFISIVEVTRLVDAMDCSWRHPSKLKNLQACYVAILHYMAYMQHHHLSETELSQTNLCMRCSIHVHALM